MRTAQWTDDGLVVRCRGQKCQFFACRSPHHRRHEGRPPVTMRSYADWCDDCVALALWDHLEAVWAADPELARELERRGFAATSAFRRRTALRGAPPRRNRKPGRQTRRERVQGYVQRHRARK